MLNFSSKKIWSFVAKLADILGIVSVITTAIIAYSSISQSSKYVWLIYLEVGLIAIFLILHFVYNYMIGEKELNSYKESINNNKFLLKLLESTSKIIKQDVYDLINCDDLSIREIRTNTINVLDRLTTYLSEMFHEEISGCVKLFKGDKKLIETFCRNNNSKNRNNISKEVETSGCTAFEDILEKELSFFAIPDMIKYDEELRKKGLEYKNPTKNWRKYYKTTIVVPLSCYDNSSNNVKLIGFLCIDANKENIFGNTQEEMEQSILLMEYFANILYCYINSTFSLRK